MREERFRDIKGFPGYQISDQGRVKSNKQGKSIYLLATGGNTPHGKYARVTLFKEGKRHYKTIHRLVATAFVPNDDPKNKIIINHIDENRSNNVYTNLEWCTYSYNNNYGTRNTRAGNSISHSLSLSGNTNKVFAYKDGVYIFFNSDKQCGRYFGVNRTLIARISSNNAGYNIKGVHATSIHGYLLFPMSIIKDFNKNIEPIEPIKFIRRRIKAINGGTSLVFNSISDAEKSNRINLKHTAIWNSLKTGRPARGWTFSYLEEDN